MKYLNYLTFAAVFLCGMVLFAQTPAPAPAARRWSELFNWSLLISGSWEEVSSTGGTLHNRGDFKLNYLPLGLTFRAEVLDRRSLSFNFFEYDPQKAVTNLLGGLYHKTTGSRLLFGVLDEWGLSARIRNPWIRSPPYAENHKPLMADLKTAASSTKNDEAYLYLSSPVMDIFSDIKLRGFVSAQTEFENFTPALAGGVDITLPKKAGLLFEVFYTGATLPPSKNSTWFSTPPPLPQREFDLFATGFIFHNQLLSVSTDWAISDTFAWGIGIYGNLGVTITPPFGSDKSKPKRPMSISFAADGASERFVYRDGANHGEGFRSAVKMEWKGKSSSLLRLNTVLRGPGFGESFNRSSTGFYYRFPANKNNDGKFPVRITRVSLTADRNAENLQKINDRLSGNIGFSLNLPDRFTAWFKWADKFSNRKKIPVNSPLGINISGSIRGLTAMENRPLPYPVPTEPWTFDNAGINCEFFWSPSIFQFRSRIGYTKNVKNDGIWDISLSTAANTRYGRFSLKTISPNFPKKWNFTVSWRLEMKKN